MDGIEKIVIIPQFTSQEYNGHYIPNFVKIHTGDTIRWINKDTQSHTLLFYNINEQSNESNFIFRLGPIPPEQSMALTFNNYHSRIDYRCEIHNNEINYILFLSEETDNMTNTERLRYLSRKFNIIPPDFMGHLDGTVNR